MDTKKYEITDVTKIYDNIILHQIRSLDGGRGLGGWIEHEDNLSHDGECWVEEGSIACGADTMVSGDALIFSQSIVSGGAKVSDEAWVSSCAIIDGNVNVIGNSWVYGGIIKNNNGLYVYGDANISGVLLYTFMHKHTTFYVQSHLDKKDAQLIEWSSMPSCQTMDLIELWYDNATGIPIEKWLSELDK